MNVNMNIWMSCSIFYASLPPFFLLLLFLYIVCLCCVYYIFIVSESSFIYNTCTCGPVLLYIIIIIWTVSFSLLLPIIHILLLENMRIWDTWIRRRKKKKRKKFHFLFFKLVVDIYSLLKGSVSFLLSYLLCIHYSV